MRNKILFALVMAGVAAAFVSAYVHAVPAKPLAPVFNPAPNPYRDGIYANGIIESYQSNGANINLYPEVSGTVVEVLVREGQRVERGTALLRLEDSVQRALVAQQGAQVAAAQAMLEELRAQPRNETLQVSRAQVELATASLKSARDSLAKQERSYQLNSESVSKDALDNAINAEKVAAANLQVVTRQRDLVRAGAWIYDVRNQERQVEALDKALSASSALLAKYVLHAPTDGVVLSIPTAVGSYLSPQGGYDPYTQSMTPAIVMGTERASLAVRVYVDEILIPRLPPGDRMRAQMFIRGSDLKIPLDFVRVQPLVSPKIQLSNQRQEKVDVRVLPVIFRFTPPADMQLFPGQLVDVYVGHA